MTLGELINEIDIQGTVKVQCFENEDYPTIYYEGDIDCSVPKELKDHTEKEVLYMYPYAFDYKSVCIAGICIELENEED